jgi:hypothetical protein
LRSDSSDRQITLVRDAAEVPGGSTARRAASFVLVLIFNGTVGYQNCLNALAGSAACRVTAWLIVVSSWSVRSSRLLART